MDEFFDDISISKKELEEIVRSCVEKGLQTMLEKHGLVIQKQTEEADYVSLAELCKAIDVTKQTVYNWQKKEVTNIMLIKPYKKKFGNRTVYNLEGIRNALNKNRFLVRDRSYGKYLKLKES